MTSNEVWKKYVGRGITGLANCGNTCFCLKNTQIVFILHVSAGAFTPFKKFFSEKKHCAYVWCARRGFLFLKKKLV